MTLNIRYNSAIQCKLKESEEQLKTFSKLNSNRNITIIPNLSFYEELDKNFDDISIKLKELRLCYEYNYFLSISDYILYIVRQNSIDSTFGHCNFAVELFDFFIEFFKTNLEFYKSTSKTDDEFEKLQKSFKERYWDYRCIFYSDIYQPSGDFTDEEMYEIHKSLRK